MQETYTIAFDMDFGVDILQCAVLERDKNGEVRLVNVIEGDSVKDIYEFLTGRDPED